MKRFIPVPTPGLADDACLHHRPGAFPERVTLDTPAVAAMTDFRRVAAVTIGLRVPISEANRKMIENGIRLLLVVEDPDLVLGLITASDVLGEKPMQLVHQRGARHSEIEVGDVATLRETLEVMQMRDVLNARVGDVVATLRRTNRQHALAVEPVAGDSCHAVRGLFSASQIARQLGVPVHVGDVARTFAEIEALLNQSPQRALRFARA
jgi:predicted transcriptional regulator